MGVNLYRGSLDRSTHTVELLGGAAWSSPGPTSSAMSRTSWSPLAPTAVTLHAERPDRSSPAMWAGVVRAMEPLGERVRVEVAGPPMRSSTSPRPRSRTSRCAPGHRWAVRQGHRDVCRVAANDRGLEPGIVSSPARSLARHGL